ncbi:MAG: PilZ domain-containing protein [Deltaproteobacteria bacterium]|nr:PilZ domain-containing protein [Deltaproteobacteria bacterium]
MVIELHFPELPNKMMLRGVVRSWRAALPRLGIRAGAVVAFDGADAEKRDFVMAVAAGHRPAAVKRRHPRVPVDFEIRWRRANAPDSAGGELGDISIGGAQLVTEEPLTIGDEIVVELKTPGGAHPISIASKVTCRTPTGYGLRFIYRDGGGSRRLREVVRRLIAQVPG